MYKNEMLWRYHRCQVVYVQKKRGSKTGPSECSLIMLRCTEFSLLTLEINLLSLRRSLTHRFNSANILNILTISIITKWFTESKSLLKLTSDLPVTSSKKVSKFERHQQPFGNPYWAWSNKPCFIKRLHMCFLAAFPGHLNSMHHRTH